MFLTAGLLILLLSMIAIILAAGFFIKSRPWPNQKKKFVFTLVTAFSLFPVFIPAGIMAAIPAPNILFVVLSFFNGAALQIPVWYLKTITFSGSSFIMTGLIMFLISHMMFFERKF